MRLKSILLVCCVGLGLLLASCQQQTPTAVVEKIELAPSATFTAEPTATHTAVPTHTPTATPRPEPSPTPEPTATNTATPSATPQPSFSAIIHIEDDSTGAAMAGATGRLENTLPDVDWAAEQAADSNGTLLFTGLEMGSYTLTIAAEGYLTATTWIEVLVPQLEETVYLKATTLAQVTAASANLRYGPGTIYAVVDVAQSGDTLQVTGRSENGEWLQILTTEGAEAWVAASLLTFEWELDAMAAVPAPPTPTPGPTNTPAPVAYAPPPAAAPPAGPNLLLNPGFEDGGIHWTKWGSSPGVIDIYTVADYPQFIHSGNQAAADGYIYQEIQGTVPGQTYRLGAWAHLWSSTGENRSISENPASNVFMYVCINTEGDSDPWLDTSVCSDNAYPLDTWQYLSIDAVATDTRITIILMVSRVYVFTVKYEPHWDDAHLSIASIAATPTPLPGPPPRPAPISFNAVALRDSMTNARSMLEQTGGLLDRLYNGQGATCEEYNSFYDGLITTAIYSGVPADWQPVYNEYYWAVENGLATNEAIYSLCTGGGGRLSYLNYSAARMGVNESLDRLNPALETANALLGQ